MNDFLAALHLDEPAWLAANGPESGVVISTRARLARNLRSFPFPHRATEVELATVRGELQRRIAGSPGLAGAEWVEMADFEPARLRLLPEAGLASPEYVARPASRAICAPRVGSYLLLNEADHLHLVSLRSGFAPDEAVRDVLDLDSDLEERLDPAFDEEWGYLTSSPAAIGTGLRISALLHLPGLMLAGEIEKICNALGQLQFKVQGLYQRGQAVRGSVFQISNLTSLGQSEEEMARDFRFHLERLIRHEHGAREQLLARDPVGVQDMVHRNLAILASARLITSQEAIDRISQVRLGVDLGLLERPGLRSLNEAMRQCRRGHLEAARGTDLNQRERAAARADFLREMVAPRGGSTA